MSTHNSKSVGSWILFGFSAQHAILSWILGLLSLATFFTHRPRFEGAAILSLRLRDWFSKSRRRNPDGSPDKGLSRYSTTLFRAIFWHEDREIPQTAAEEVDTTHERHERAHINQFENACVRGFFAGFVVATMLWVTGACAEVWGPLLVWELVWFILPIMLMADWFVAILRYGPAAKVRPSGEKRSFFARIYDRAYLDSEIERSARAQTEGGWDVREAEKR